MAKATFLNIDLDLRSRSGLPKLLDAFGKDVYVLHKRRDYASLEVSFGPTNTIDQVIRCYYKIFCKLSPAARRLWNQCQVRAFNIGFSGGTRPEHHCGVFSLSKKSLELLNEMNGTVVISISSAYED